VEADESDTDAREGDPGNKFGLDTMEDALQGKAGNRKCLMPTLDSKVASKLESGISDLEESRKSVMDLSITLVKDDIRLDGQTNSFCAVKNIILAEPSS